MQSGYLYTVLRTLQNVKNNAIHCCFVACGLVAAFERKLRKSNVVPAKKFREIEELDNLLTSIVTLATLKVL